MTGDETRPLPHLSVGELVDLALDADREFYEKLVAEAPTPREKRICEGMAAAAAERRRRLRGPSDTRRERHDE